MPFKDWDDGIGGGSARPVVSPFFASRLERFLSRRRPPATASSAESHAPDRSDVEVIPRNPDANRDDGDAMLHKGEVTSWRVVAFFSREYEATAMKDEAYSLGAYAVALTPLDDNGDQVWPNG